MNDLQPLDIVDNRSLAQIRAEGCERWENGQPYIVRGNCAVCGAQANQDHDCLQKLEQPVPCELELDVSLIGCAQPAHWRLNGVAMCDEEIVRCAEMNSDNAVWLAPALVDIATRTATQNLAQYFEHIAENLSLLANEQKRPLSAVHTVEFVPGVPDRAGVACDWVMHINDEQFMHVERDHRGKLDVGFHAWYADFEDLLNPTA